MSSIHIEAHDQQVIFVLQQPCKNAVVSLSFCAVFLHLQFCLRKVGFQPRDKISQNSTSLFLPTQRIAV